MIKKLLLIVLSAITQQLVVAQSSFFKTFIPQDYEYFKNMVPCQGGYAFVTTAAFYRMDAQGNQLVKKVISEGSYSQFFSITPVSNQLFWTALYVSEGQDKQHIQLLKLDAQGNTVQRKTVPVVGSFDHLQLATDGNDGLYLAYKHRERPEDDAHIDILYMNAAGNDVWKKELSHPLYNYFSIRAVADGKLSLCYQVAGSMRTWLMMAAPNGSSTYTEIKLPVQVSQLDIATNFNPTPDGGCIFSGISINASNSGNALAFKTDAAGNLQWQKTYDFLMEDFIIDIAPVADGYLAVADVNRSKGSDEVSGDILLIKLDAQGKQLWTKAFGSAKSDYARQLLVLPDGAAMVAAMVSYGGQVVPIPAVFKTTPTGEIPATNPLNLEPASAIKILADDHPSTIKRLIKATPGAAGGFVMATSIFEKESGAFYAYTKASDKDGLPLWREKLEDNPGDIKLVQRLTDGHTVAITEYKSAFQHLYIAIKQNPAGDTVWTARLGANNITDAIATADGGCLITGAVDISFVNYEVVLIRLDGNGKILWQKTIGERAQWETGRKIKQLPDGGFIIAGSNQTEFDITASFHLLRIDANGNKMFAKDFSQGITTSIAYDIQVTTNGDFVIVGNEAVQPFDNKKLVLLKTDAQGNLLWQKRYNLPLLSSGLALLPSANGGFILAGTTGEPMAGTLEKFVFLLHTDAEGNQLSAKFYGKKGVQTSFASMLPDGNQLILFGTIQEEYGKEKMFFTKTGLSAEPREPEQPVADSLLLVPNPAMRGNSQLWIMNGYSGHVSIVLYNASGQRMVAYHTEKNTPKLVYPLSVHGFAAGVYFVVVEMGGEKYAKRLVVL